MKTIVVMVKMMMSIVTVMRMEEMMKKKRTELEVGRSCMAERSRDRTFCFLTIDSGSCLEDDSG